MPSFQVVSKPDVYPASGFLPPYQRDPLPYPTEQTGMFMILLFTVDITHAA